MPGRVNSYVHVVDAGGKSHVFGPSDDVPAWAAKVIDNESVWAEKPATDMEGYSSLKLDELRAEIAKRNEGRNEADLIPPAGTKADLVAALEADDT